MTATNSNGSVSYDTVEHQSKDILSAILLRFSKSIQSILKGDYLVGFQNNVINQVDTYLLRMHKEDLVSFVKGVLCVYSNENKYYETYFNTNPEGSFAIIQKLVNGVNLQECEHELNELFLKKFNTKIYDSSELILWFHSLSSRHKRIVILALYMKIHTDEEESEAETETETEAEAETETEAEEEELFECGDCGNVWDGFAQCNCFLDSPVVYDSQTVNTPPRTRSQTKNNSHPRGWDSHNHYGMCGQSCPCCRAEVGDTLGACPICK